MDTRCYVCFDDNTDLAPLKALLPAERLAQLEGKAPRLRRQSTLAEALLRITLSSRFSLSPREVSVTRAGNGKPECPLCCISASHTDGAVAAAFSAKPVGVDIELMRPPRLLAAKALFSPWEMALAPEYFWEIWTRKEAMAKATGTGLYRQMPDTFAPPLSEKLFTHRLGECIISLYCEDKHEIVSLTTKELISML